MTPFIDELPRHYGRSPQDAELQRVLWQVVNKVEADLDFTLAQLFASTASGWGLELWENTFGLQREPGQTEALRRARVLAKLRGTIPSTPEQIRAIAQTFAPWRVEVREFQREYRFEVWFLEAEEALEHREAMRADVNERKPAHLAWLTGEAFRPVELKNQQVFWLGALYTHLRGSNYGQEIIRLDGRRRLDGSWLLNQGLIRGPALYQIMARMRAGSKSKLFALVKVRAEAGRAGSVHVGGTYRAKGTIRHRAGLPAVVVSTGAANRFFVSTAVTADTMWRLDGTYRLNGEKKLNAKIVRSEF